MAEIGVDEAIANATVRSGKMSVSDIFRDDLGKPFEAPTWLSTQLFSSLSPPESLTTIPSATESDPKLKLDLDDDSSGSSDDGLGNAPEFLSGRYIPSASISRFSSFLPRPAPTRKDGDSDDDDQEEEQEEEEEEEEDALVDATRPEGQSAEIPVDWGGTPASDESPAAPPPAPPVPAADFVQPDESATEILRKSVVAILDVQSRYVKALRLVERSYINVIRASNVLHRKPRLMNDAEMTATFVNWRDLVTIATELKRALRQGRQSAGENDITALTSILNAIAGHIASYSRIYTIFVSEFTYSTKLMEQTKRRREAFAELVELNEACDKIPLTTLMAYPLNYMSELRDAVRRLNRGVAPESEPVLANVQRSGLDVLCTRTYSAIARLDDEIHREKTLSEARSRVGQVQEFLFDGKVNLVSPGRYCVRYGALLKLTNANKKDGKLLTFFLFNDLFLGADGKGGQMRVKYVLDLQDLKVTQTAAAAFHIESSVKSLLLAASNEANARAWIQDIKERAEAQQQCRTASRLDPLALAALIRDETKRIDSTVSISVRESHDILTSKKESTLVSMATTMQEPSMTGSSPIHAMTNSELTLNDDETVSEGLAQAATTTFKIHLTAANEEIGLGSGMQGYLKLKGTTFGSLSTMFFVVNAVKQELHAWKLKADALKTAPKKSIALRDSVAFASDFPEGAGIELYPVDNRRGYALIAPDASIRDAWCLAIGKYRSAERVCEDFFEKRGGSDGQKPWRTRYFVMCRSSRNILYFNKRQDSAGPDWQLNANGSIDVSNCMVRRMDCNEALETMDRSHVLELAPEATQRHFYIAAKDEAVLVRWMDEIRRLASILPESDIGYCPLER